MTKSMTSGKPVKLILLFALPLIVGNIFQQFYKPHNRSAKNMPYKNIL